MNVNVNVSIAMRKQNVCVPLDMIKPRVARV